MKRLAYVRRALKRLPRPPGGRLRSIAWLADELGLNRVVLYGILRGDRVSAPVEDALREMFPGLPRALSPEGAEEL